MNISLRFKARRKSEEFEFCEYKGKNDLLLFALLALPFRVICAET